MRAMELCRTAALGGHTEQCDACAHIRVSYNSCRNPHCGKCQALARAAWLEARQADLLPVPYFHVVLLRSGKSRSSPLISANRSPAVRVKRPIELAGGVR